MKNTFYKKNCSRQIKYIPQYKGQRGLVELLIGKQKIAISKDLRWYLRWSTYNKKNF